jgi:ankyrin repeat protein
MKDHSGRTPLHYAIYNGCNGQIKILEKLLLLGADINAVDESRKTPLHFAAEAGKASIIPLLVQNGASTARQDLKGKTPVDLACSSHVRELIIVYSPHNARFKPKEADLERMAIDGNTMNIKKIEDLDTKTNYYEPFEHAQPKKALKKRKLNAKPGCEQEIKEDQFPISFHCACAANKIPTDQRPMPPPEELCSVCRPLGPVPDWQNADRKNLPYNMRNY